MKIIKRNGSEVPFDITKIITAVTKASDSVSRKSSLTQEQILSIANDVTEQCQALNRAVSVEEIQDMVATGSHPRRPLAPPSGELSSVSETERVRSSSPYFSAPAQIQ